ncbi:MAG: secretin N-terminal domain-containing protein [Acidobacteriota bacterium]
MFDAVRTTVPVPVVRRGLWLLALGCLAASLTAVPIAGQAAPSTRTVVHAQTLEHRSAADAADLVRPMLTHRGTVEEQPGGNTLVVRDVAASVQRIVSTLRAFDQPPRDLAFDIRIVRAAARRGLISPPPEDVPIDAELPPELVERLRALLRYDDYEVLAQAGVRSREGEAVTYSLGDRYDVSFKPGMLLGGSRLKLEGFTITKKPRQTTDKGRRLEPRELFHATLNLWLDRPFIVLAPTGDDALMIAISCRPIP